MNKNMSVIFSNGEWNIYNGGIETYDQLPAGFYKVMFDERKGFFLVGAEEVKNTEKVYGDLAIRTIKTFNAYDKSSRSIGVLMSGQKGIGKTMMARLLCEKAIERGMPVIIIPQYVPGLATYLGCIHQPALILFDEFEKLCRGRDGNEAGSQPEILSLLDGLYSEKWLFVLTCNYVSDVSTYLLGRPGRIHYHFEFKMPLASEIREYLKDNIPEDKWPQIDEVVKYAKYAKINYDSLRAIAFEFNLGGDFKEFITDLNVEKNGGDTDVRIYATFESGVTVCAVGGSLDLSFGNSTPRFGFDMFCDADGTHGRSLDACSIRLYEYDICQSFSGDGTYAINPERIKKCQVITSRLDRRLKNKLEPLFRSLESITIVPEGKEFKELIDEWDAKTFKYTEITDGNNYVEGFTFHLPNDEDLTVMLEEDPEE